LFTDSDNIIMPNLLERIGCSQLAGECCVWVGSLCGLCYCHVGLYLEAWGIL